MPSYSVEHFGCRAARADGEAVSDGLRAGGRQFLHVSGYDSKKKMIILNIANTEHGADYTDAAAGFLRIISAVPCFDQLPGMQLASRLPALTPAFCPISHR